MSCRIGGPLHEARIVRGVRLVDDKVAVCLKVPLDHIFRAAVVNKERVAVAAHSESAGTIGRDATVALTGFERSGRCESENGE